jgi:hypothetical protein
VSARSSSPRPGADVDHWVWQLQTLEDLAAFTREHGPRSALPLPVLNWTVGAFRTVSAELASYDPNALATLAAYAAALGADVTERAAPDRTVYTVKGRLGRREGTEREPRIGVVIRATVWRELDGDDQ